MISKAQIKLIRSLELKKNRRKEGLFIAEGPKVVDELLRAGFKPHSIYSTGHIALPSSSEGASSVIQLITEEELQRISLLQHPQDVLALFHIPSPISHQTSNISHQTSAISHQTSNISHLPPEGLFLALDGVQDPGNVGTIIRIADWFGIDAVYCSPDTADVYNPKVVQATMGSLAHVPVIYCDLQQLLKEAQCPVYGTLLDGNDIYRQSLTPHGIIVMGNEGNGISSPIRQLITHRLLIPNYSQGSHQAESLNVAIATAITCSEFRRSTSPCHKPRL